MWVVASWTGFSYGILLHISNIFYLVHISILLILKLHLNTKIIIDRMVGGGRK